jgi:predicted DNA-binding antitoxin AbrB/MazE fold protein
MTKTLEATFDGTVFRPDEPVELQPNTRVQIVVTVKTQHDEHPTSFLRVAKGLRLQGPADWSSRLDDYLYGGAQLNEQ